MPLSQPAQQLLDALTAPDAAPDQVMVLPIPYGTPADERKVLIDHHQAVVNELRDAGWPAEVIVRRNPDGEALAIGLAPDAPRPDAA